MLAHNLKLLILTWKFIEVHGWSCPSGPPGIQNVYKKEQDEVDLFFQSDISSTGTLVSYNIRGHAGLCLFSVSYLSNDVFGNTSVNGCNGCTFIGDTTTGNLSIRIGPLTLTDAGVYRLERTISGQTTVTTCKTLFLLGSPTIPSIVSDKNPEVGESVTLTCNSNSTTTPSNHSLSLDYKWMLNGTSLQSNSKYTVSGNKLTVAGVTRIDSWNRFYCTATEVITNGYPSITRNNFMINVLYGPVNIQFTPSKDVYEETEGTNIPQVTCSADCNTECTYRWNKVSHTTTLVTNSAILNLGTLHRSEAGIYRCTARRDGSNILTKELTVNVIYGPNALSFTPVKTEYTQNENTVFADITCDAACYPTCTYTWTNLQTNTVVSRTGVLSLGTLDKNKAATYQCTATNPEKSGTLSKQVKVLVRYGPDMCNTNVSSTHTVTEGNNPVSITCTSDCYPSCSYQWRNVSDNKVIKQDGSMELEKISRYEAGSYKCMCQNDAPEYKISKDTTILLIVQYPPDVTIISSSKNFTEGNNLSLQCEAKGVPVVYTYTGFIQTWNGTPINNQHIAASGNQANRTFDTNALQLQDSGIYTCYVNNKIKNRFGVLKDSFSSLEVHVKGKPKIKGANKFAGKTDETISIETEFYCFPAVKTAEFKRFDGTVITNSSNKYTVSHYETQIIDNFYGTEVKLNGGKARMVIRDLVQENFGNYTLTISNDEGNSSLNFVIVAESEPSEPSDFSHSYKDSRHFFSWVGAFNGGHKQTFVIQTTPLGKTDWVNRTSVEEKQGEEYLANITTLLPGMYNARIYSWNSKGQSEYVNLTETITVKDTTTSPPFPVTSAVGGGVGSAVVFLLIVAGVVFWYKRRNKSKDGHKAHLKDGDASGSDDEDEVNTVNPMYISADEVNERNTTYAQPDKGAKNDVYAMVNKKPKVDSDANNLYAFPDKKGKKKQTKEGKNVKKKAVGDELQMAKKKPSSDYGKNPETYVKPKKNVSKDGLIYADLAFNNQPKGQKKLVIHGLDSTTEYVEVDFTKRADPLPDSDEEKDNNC